MAYLGFNDGTGYVVLRNVMPAPADRFANFVTERRPVGDMAMPLTTGRRVMWTFREEIRCSFSLPYLSPRSLGGDEPTLSRALRFQLHARKGGAFDVAVEDESGQAVQSGYLADGADVTIELADPADRFYTLTLTVVLPNILRPVYGGYVP